MAPTTRTLSNTSTPTKTPTKASKAATEDGGTPKVTPRKTPHCHTCGQPMRGHTRKGGCPTNSDSPSNAEKRVDSSMLDSFQSLDIAEHAEDETPTTPRKAGRKSAGRRSLTPRKVQDEGEPEDTKAVIRERRKSERAARQTVSHAESLASLDSYSAELVANLLQAEDSSDNELPEGTQKTVHWDEGIAASNSSNGTERKVKKERIAMPCSFNPPSPFSSFAESSASSRGSIGSARPSNGNASADVVRGEKKPLDRTMSMEARALYLDKLEGKATAQFFMVPDAEVADFQDQVPKGLFIRTLPAGAENPGHNIIVIGRNEGDVEKLYQSLKKDGEPTRRRSSGFGMAASGAVVGAVATFAGLAYT
ncbi:hypothetical protein PM082_005870 [Marasmius tenuissimus]|nr:hypothetical protein PM082_005870 [Marasmius tenuissimus]